MEITFETLPQAISEIQTELTEIKRLILNRCTELQQPEDDKLLTIQQAAELLNLSVPTLYGYVHRAEIPVMKKTKRLYFSKKLLHEWVLLGRRKTISEIAAEADQYLNAKKKQV